MSAFWQEPAPTFRDNILLNANYNIWQEFPTYTLTTGVGGVNSCLWRHDRGTGATVIISRQAFTVGQTDVPGNPEFFMRVNRTVAGSAASAIGQRVEGIRSAVDRSEEHTSELQSH